MSSAAGDKYEGGGAGAWFSAGRHINHHVSPLCPPPDGATLTALHFSALHTTSLLLVVVYISEGPQNHPGVQT